MTSQNRLLTIGLILVALAAVGSVLLVVRQQTDSPYAATTPERASQARQRVEVSRQLGVPGMNARR